MNLYFIFVLLLTEKTHDELTCRKTCD